MPPVRTEMIYTCDRCGTEETVRADTKGWRFFTVSAVVQGGSPADRKFTLCAPCTDIVTRAIAKPDQAAK